MKKGFFAPALLFAVVFLIFPKTFADTNVAEAAFGISPPFLYADHLVKGAHYVQTIYLVQDQPDQDLPIKTVIDINDRVRGWFTINDNKPIVIPKGVRQFPVVIDIKVPSNADLGIYHGSVSFESAPPRTGQVTIALGVELSLNFTVGTGIYEEYSVPLIKFLDIEEGWSPKVYVRFVNKGNVPEAFDSAIYELMDKFGAVRLAYIQKAEGFPETPPFTTQEYTVEFPIDLHLGIGGYWGNVTFYKNDKVMRTDKGVFSVLKAGSISGPFARFLNYMKVNWEKYLAGFVVIVVGWFLVRRWRGRMRRRRAHAVS